MIGRRKSTSGLTRIDAGLWAERYLDADLTYRRIKNDWTWEGRRSGERGGGGTVHPNMVEAQNAGRRWVILKRESALQTGG